MMLAPWRSLRSLANLPRAPLISGRPRALSKRLARKPTPAMELVDRVLAKRVGAVGLTHDFPALPRQAGAETIVRLSRRILFPGIFIDSRLHEGNVKYHLGMLLFELKEVLEDQVARALLHARTDRSGPAAEECAAQARGVAVEFLQAIPRLRGVLKMDVAASLRGDPAARSEDEIVMCYPGFEAVFIHRMAHELHRLRVPLIPRMMASYAHERTAIDIHPGARIGSAVFMDHGTGIVIGETSVIGRNVKLFHGVTLGAHSYVAGQAMAGMKRHPTIEDDVTIYAGAVILGGDTVIGAKAVVGGSIWITSSIPPGHVVLQPPKALSILPIRSKIDPFQAFDPCI